MVRSYFDSVLSEISSAYKAGGLVALLNISSSAYSEAALGYHCCAIAYAAQQPEVLVLERDAHVIVCQIGDETAVVATWMQEFGANEFAYLIIGKETTFDHGPRVSNANAHGATKFIAKYLLSLDPVKAANNTDEERKIARLQTILRNNYGVIQHL